MPANPTNNHGQMRIFSEMAESSTRSVLVILGGYGGVRLTVQLPIGKVVLTSRASAGMISCIMYRSREGRQTTSWGGNKVYGSIGDSWVGLPIVELVNPSANRRQIKVD